MLDFFTILSKGGFVLWCYTLQGVKVNIQESVNAMIKGVILQERSGSAEFNHGSLLLKCKLDNEFELIFVVGYQKFLKLAYIDKLIDDVQRRFRDTFKQNLMERQFSCLIQTNFDFGSVFKELLKRAELRKDEPIAMKTYHESEKAQKTVDSLKQNQAEPTTKKSKKKKKNINVAPAIVETPQPVIETQIPEEVDDLNDEIKQRRLEWMQKQQGKLKKTKPSPKPALTKKVKTERKWGNKISKEDAQKLNYSDISTEAMNGHATDKVDHFTEDQMNYVGTGAGEIKDLEYEDDIEEKGAETQSSGMFGMFKGLVSSKALTEESLKPVLVKMSDHLIGKNVATDIAEKLCQSVSAKLEGKVLGTFSSVTSTVKQCVQETLVQILTPKRRVDILRDVLEAQRNKKQYVITFCGVNGVGKSTNLAKVCFWLLENGFNVLVAACDTFRAGAVEQLRTHVVRLNTLHPVNDKFPRDRVGLFEKGYGKDAAGIAMQAITYAKDTSYDVVLVDTAGRMQDNEPLMRSLSKLIAVNQPDLVLFVGEALVGNEAVDQLTKFNQALADYSRMENPRLIDGIVLTKFDTIDDKVGAAISMTYTTGQPIVFVGTGQSYPDLRSLNAKAVVNALLK